MTDPEPTPEIVEAGANLDASSASSDRGWQRSERPPGTADLAIEMSRGESGDNSWIREHLQFHLGTGYLRRSGW